MKRMFTILAGSLSLVGVISGPAAQLAAVTDQELMDILKDAAPAAVLKGATILNMGADGQMKAIKSGTNGWTCMDPGGAPMCADEAAMEWAKAWKSKGPAPQKLGFITTGQEQHWESDEDLDGERRQVRLRPAD